MGNIGSKHFQNSKMELIVELNTSMFINFEAINLYSLR